MKKGGKADKYIELFRKTFQKDSSDEKKEKALKKIEKFLSK